MCTITLLCGIDTLARLLTLLRFIYIQLLLQSLFWNISLLPCLAPAFLNACLDLRPWCFFCLVLWSQIAHHKEINSNLLEVEEVLRSKVVVSLAFSVHLFTNNHLRVVVLSTLEVVLCCWEECSIPYTHNGKIILGHLKDQSRGFNWKIAEDGDRTYLRTGTCKSKPIHLLWVTFCFFPDIICIVADTKKQFSCGMVQVVKNVNWGTKEKYLITISLIYTRITCHLLDVSFPYEVNAAFLWVSTAEFGPVF